MNSIAFYNVDFYKDYENVIDFDSAALREQYFASKAIAGLETENIQVVKPPYEYVKVAGNYNDFQSVNYAIISLDITADGETSSRDYYCFVDKVDYAGDGVVGLAMTLDVWQTALFAPDGTAGFELQESFVERAHVNYFESASAPDFDRTYLDVPEDFNVGDRVYKFQAEPGVTISKQPDFVAPVDPSEVVFLVINYTSPDIASALLGFTFSEDRLYGGNFGGPSPVKTAVIPVIQNAGGGVGVRGTIYGEIDNGDGTFDISPTPFPSWNDLLLIDNDNPGVLIGKTGIVSMYLEKELPGGWRIIGRNDGSILVSVKNSPSPATQYELLYDLSTPPTGYTLFFPRSGNVVRNGELNLQGIVPVAEMALLNRKSEETPDNVQLPWTVEKKAYCYPYCYAILSTDRGFEYVVKPQFVPKIVTEDGAAMGFGSIPIAMIYACADFRKLGYFVPGYKKDTVTLTENLDAVVWGDNMLPEMFDMAVNNNQTDVPLISDALVEYVQTKKASERAGLVVQGANAVIGAGLALGLGGANPITAAAGGALSIAGNIATVLARRKDLENTPNTVRSPGNDYGFEYAANSAGLSLFSVSPTMPRLKEIINYFERFGIAIKKSVQLNTRCRAYWNFAKTIGARVVSPLTSEYTSKLRDIFDAGVRIWHYRAGQTFYGVGVYKDNAGADLWNGEIYE